MSVESANIELAENVTAVTFAAMGQGDLVKALAVELAVRPPVSASAFIDEYAGLLPLDGDDKDNGVEDTYDNALSTDLRDHPVLNDALSLLSQWPVHASSDIVYGTQLSTSIPLMKKSFEEHGVAVARNPLAPRDFQPLPSPVGMVEAFSQLHQSVRALEQYDHNKGKAELTAIKVIMAAAQKRFSVAP